MLDEKKRRNEIFELINNAIIFYNAFLDVSILHICVSSCIRNVSVQFSRSVVSDSLWPHELQHTRLPCPSPSSRSFFKLLSIESVMPSNYLILCCPLLLLPSVFPSSRVFSNKSVLRIRWPNYWSFSFSIISPSNEHSGLISFRMDWLDLLAVQGTLTSLLQHHSLKACNLSQVI